MNKKIILLLFIVIAFTFILTGCENKNNEDDIKLKVNEEFNYLDTKIVNVLNGLNNISLQNYTITSEEITLGQKTGGKEGNQESTSQGNESGKQQKESSSETKSSEESEKSKITVTEMEPKSILETNENDIDWKTIKSEIEIINRAWAVVILDLSSLNVNNNDILEFSNTLDDCVLSIKDENKTVALTNFAKLYSIIPKMQSQVSNKDNVQKIKQVKSYLINAYSLTEVEDWAGIESNIGEAEKIFREISTDIEFIKNKEYKVNRAYVLIKELQNSLSRKDKKLFYIKYKNLIENINLL